MRPDLHHRREVALEQGIQSRIESGGRGRYLVVIAHDPSTSLEHRSLHPCNTHDHPSAKGWRAVTTIYGREQDRFNSSACVKTETR
jgi:hypothetical protein